MIYIISNNNGLYKIGKSQNPIARLSQLQTGCPQRLKIVKTFDYNSKIEGINETIIERRIHYLLKVLKVRHNGEWFRFADESSLIEVCDRIIKKGFGYV